VTIHTKCKKDVKLLIAKLAIYAKRQILTEPSELSFSCFQRRRALGTAKCAELDEDGYVLNHSSKGANQPGQVSEEVFLVLRVEQNL
jgi:hypothetical protein